MRAVVRNRLILTGSLAGLGIAVSGGAFSGNAFAQSSDTSPNLPDVLLLLDTSGDMVVQPDGTPPSCGGGNDDRSNWALVVEALTGSIQKYNCLDGGRVRSNSCLPGQNSAAAAFTLATDWPTNSGGPAEKREPVIFDDGSGGWCKEKKNEWDQAKDGIVDGFARQIRFGLMTSDLGHLDDTSTASPVGYGTWQGGTLTDPEYSYVGTFLTPQGSYGNQSAGLQDWDAGGRNQSAPPWEGRLMGFGNSTAAIDEVVSQNERIQRAILAIHPKIVVGGTADASPAAGLLRDAEDFLIHDATPPVAYPMASDPTFLMSCAGDAAFTGGCRPVNVVFISTGKFGNDMTQPVPSGVLPGDGYDQAWEGSYACPPCGPACSTCYNVPTSCANPFDGGTCPFAGAGPAVSAGNMGAAGIVTHVVGVVPSTKVTYKKPSGSCSGHGVLNGPSCDVDCSALDASDFGTSSRLACAQRPLWPVGPAAYAAAPGGAWPALPKWRNDRGRPQDGPPGDLSQCCELASIAIASQTSNGLAKPPLYFIQDVSGLKSALADVVSKVQGGTTSRTSPVYIQAAPTLQVGPPTVNATAALAGNALASSFELLSSLRVSLGNLPTPAAGVGVKAPMWRGFLERRRLVCSGNVPQADAIDEAKGDDYASNLVEYTATPTRRFITVAVKSGGAPASLRSLRRKGTNLFSGFLPAGDPYGLLDPEAIDGLGGNEVTLADQTPATRSDLLGGVINTTYGGSQADFLEIDNKDKKKCKALFGTNNIDTCADYVLKWFGGFVDPGNTSEQFVTDRCPNAVCGWVPAQYSNQHPLGAIYHSTPVLVGPPTDYLNDEAYRRDFAVKDTATNNDGQATRPTMVYAASIDGQLHAFAVARNSAGASDPLYAATGIGPNSVPNLDVSAATNNELWSFIPPAVIPSIWRNFDSHALLLDGPLVATDIVLKRKGTSAALGNARWGTVLVGSGGGSTAGGFYYALDITNPTAPKFLWQLRTSGATDAPLFGTSVPGAAIATVSMATGPLATDPVDQVAVAILAGGSESSVPTATIARRCATCNNTLVRGTIRDWGPAVPSRSVTIVELGTGRIIKRFEGTTQDLADSSAKLDLLRSSTKGLDSPMTGTPVAFPNTPGVVATRAYVGDADGTLWRLDLSSSKPANWKIDIAADAYDASAVTPLALAGEPIQLPPVLSVDRSLTAGNLGDPIVMFTTGDQDGFQVYKSGMENYLVAIRDHYDPSGTPTFVPSALFAAKKFMDGERVTGPLALFDDTIYFATYIPGQGSTCGTGKPYVHGIDFLSGGAPQFAIDLDGSGGAPDASETTGVTSSTSALPATSVIFGAQINRIPQCNATATVTGTAGSEWFAGNYATQNSASNSSYQLSFQTGQAPVLGDNLLGATGARTNSFHANMTAPKALVTVHAWASISE